MRVRVMDVSQRGNGFTTAQMQRAPRGAVYVWPVHESLGYAKDLARSLGRGDIEVVGPSVLERGGERLRGRRLTGIVLDHACEPDAEEYLTLRYIRAACVIG